MPDRLDLQVWTPLPPQRSGVADHNLMLLPYLAGVAEVSVVVDDDPGDTVIPDHVTPVTRSEARRRHPDLAIYHMGNHHGLHRHIHDALIARPGLVVLHDPSLLDFYRAYHEGSEAGFDEELDRNHGVTFATAPRVLAGSDWHLDRLALPVLRRVVEPSAGVVVHSAWAREALAGRFPETPIHHIELAAPVADENALGSEVRRQAGWGPGHLVVGLMGGLWQHKRPELVVRIFAALHLLRPDARLLVAGRLEDAETLAPMRRLIAGAGIEGAVRVLTDVDDDEFAACLVACDVVFDIRWPSAGETSATVMRAFGAGRPAIVGDLPQYGTVDSAFCWRVPTQPSGAAPAALELLLKLADDPDRGRAAGRMARRFVEDAASPSRVADRYVEVAAAVLAADGRPATGLR